MSSTGPCGRDRNSNVDRVKRSIGPLKVSNKSNAVLSKARREVLAISSPLGRWRKLRRVPSARLGRPTACARKRGPLSDWRHGQGKSSPDFPRTCPPVVVRTLFSRRGVRNDLMGCRVFATQRNEDRDGPAILARPASAGFGDLPDQSHARHHRAGQDPVPQAQSRDRQPAAHADDRFRDRGRGRPRRDGDGLRVREGQIRHRRERGARQAEDRKLRRHRYRARGAGRRGRLAVLGKALPARARRARQGRQEHGRHLRHHPRGAESEGGGWARPCGDRPARTAGHDPAARQGHDALDAARPRRDPQARGGVRRHQRREDRQGQSPHGGDLDRTPERQVRPRHVRGPLSGGAAQAGDRQAEGQEDRLRRGASSATATSSTSPRL